MSNTLTLLLAQLDDVVVRDLAWALASPNLLSHSPLAPDNAWYEELLAEYRPRLLALERDPKVLHLYCQPYRRLGLYFEALWHFFLLDHDRFQVLAHDWQQVVDGTTLGAFDFIIWDKSLQRIEHWELAVKFYLISQPDKAFSSAVGINTHDKLRYKHQHMLHHQLALSQHPQVKPHLIQQGMLPDFRRLILKGRLYYPRSCQPLLSTQGERGYWGYDTPDPSFVPQQKLGWMTGHRRSKSLDKRQNFVSSAGDWYIQVENGWLNKARQQE